MYLNTIHTHTRQWPHNRFALLIIITHKMKMLLLEVFAQEGMPAGRWQKGINGKAMQCQTKYTRKAHRRWEHTHEEYTSNNV